MQAEGGWNSCRRRGEPSTANYSCTLALFSMHAHEPKRLLQREADRVSRKSQRPEPAD